jgi:hypothetical protein
MQTRRQNWVGDCREMSLPDEQGNTLYLDTMPLPGGNITYGLYVDKACSQESTMTFSEYVIQYYSTYYDNSDRGSEAAFYWESLFARWNELMSVYKICQPCRSYSKVATTNDQSSNDGGGGNNNNYNNNDGGGEEEQYGYNCYDDAGYRNCDQCYKFETKTDMEPATVDDLTRASAQGTILAIRVNGTVYGRGRNAFSSSEFFNFHGIMQVSEHILLGLVLGILALLLVGYCTEWCLRCRRTPTAPSSLQEVVLQKGSDVTRGTASTSSTKSDSYLYRMWALFQREKGKIQSELASKEDNLARQQEVIDQLTIALDFEKLTRAAERARLQDAMQTLKNKNAGHESNPTSHAGRVNARGFVLDRLWKKLQQDKDNKGHFQLMS